MIRIILYFVLFFASMAAWAQVPDAIAYQAIALDSEGNEISEAELVIRFSILIGDSLYYAEEQILQTSDDGHFSCSIGRGSSLNGGFSNIAWQYGEAHVQLSLLWEGEWLEYAPEPLNTVPFALFSEGMKGLRGDPGPVGEAGPVGPEGAPGLAGPAGPIGMMGPPGLPGPGGPFGAPGPDGFMGPTGFAGPQGPKGNTGPAGDEGPGIHCWDLNGNGINDPIEDINLDAVFNPLDCQGPQGYQGHAESGPSGPPSTIGNWQGPQGPQGFAGPQGPQGLDGAAGPDFISPWLSTGTALYYMGRVSIGHRQPMFMLDVDGDICSNGISINSDRRFKKNVTRLEHCSQLLQALQVRTYYYDDGFLSKSFPKGLQTGFIAQELDQLVPEVVEVDPNGHLFVDYAKMTPILLEAINSMGKDVRELQLQYEAQELRVKELLARSAVIAETEKQKP